MTAPPAPAYLTAYLHDGPFDGNEISMPWPRLELAMPWWVGDTLADVHEAVYRLRGPWLGQATAHYDYVEAKD